MPVIREQYGWCLQVVTEFESWIAADAKHFLPIHREAPPFTEQSTEQEVLVTGIKVFSITLRGLVWR